MATGRVPTTANSPLTAKGDLFGYSTTQARVPVGSDGETLVADSSASTGLRYTGGVGLAQPVINGGSDIWQRGTSIAIPSSAWTYANDRFYYYRGATGLTVSRQATNDSTNLPFIQYCTRVQRDSGNTSTVGIYHYHDIETANSIPYAGRTITISFYARKGANWSVSGDLLPFQVITGTGTDQALRSGYTGASVIIGTSATLTTTWQRFSATAAVSSTATQIGILLPNITPSGTAGAADFYEITGIQIDFGSVALPFRRAGGTIAGELLACQRYYWRNTATGSYTSFGNGYAATTTAGYFWVQHPVQMRVQPTALEWSGLGAHNPGSFISGFTTASLGDGGTRGNAILLDGAVGMTSFRPYLLSANNNSSAYIAFSAEL